MAKETVHVSVFNEEYSLVSDEAKEHLQKAASVVDQHMRDIAQLGLTDAKKIAVLTAIQLASQMLKTSEDVQKNQEMIQFFDQWIQKQEQLLSSLL